jgi:S-adenosylmethionine synthetase
MKAKRSLLFTSESVGAGHPDKLCDYISDSILDEIYKTDPNGRVACETMATTGLIVVAGEITTDSHIDYKDVVRKAAIEIGYDNVDFGLDGKSCGVAVVLDKQSPDISQGVTEGSGLHKEQGAGDQGMMFGYAINETPDLMPAPIYYANKLVKKLGQVRKNTLKYLGPDCKSQVTIQYENGKPKRFHTIVVSGQHLDSVKLSKLRKDVIDKIIKPVLPKKLLDDKTIIHVNPTGRFVVGGPHGDCGLTGRKIIVDTYGGMGRHGGGAFSGKDPSKVDRSAAYAARYIAKNIVAAGLAHECEVQLAYAIGVAKPVSINVNTYETGKVEDTRIEKAIEKIFDLTPKGIIKMLDLRRPIFKNTAVYGHFGRKGDAFTWEKTDKADELKKYFA